MVWKDTETAILDSGRAVHVHGGIIGLSLDGTTMYAGDNAVLFASDISGPSKLTTIEKLDVARYECRMWGLLAKQLEIAARIEWNRRARGGGINLD